MKDAKILPQEREQNNETSKGKQKRQSLPSVGHRDGLKAPTLPATVLVQRDSRPDTSTANTSKASPMSENNKAEEKPKRRVMDSTDHATNKKDTRKTPKAPQISIESVDSQGAMAFLIAKLSHCYFSFRIPRRQLWCSSQDRTWRSNRRQENDWTRDDRITL